MSLEAARKRAAIKADQKTAKRLDAENTARAQLAEILRPLPWREAWGDVRKATPSDAFWTFWNKHKAIALSAGVSIGTTETGWKVFISDADAVAVARAVSTPLPPVAPKAPPVPRRKVSLAPAQMAAMKDGREAAKLGRPRVNPYVKADGEPIHLLRSWVAPWYSGYDAITSMPWYSSGDIVITGGRDAQ